MPLLLVVLAPPASLTLLVSLGSLAFLGALGALGARVGGANIARATIRVTFWGTFAMALTAGIGALVGKAI